MVNSRETMKWSDLYKRDVNILSEGRVAGIVDDFYLKEGTNAIYALKVHTRIEGDFALPASAIEAIEPEAVTVKSAEMLTKALPPLPLGSTLISCKVVGEKGEELGTVNEIWLGIVPPVALRVAAFEMASNSARSHHNKGFTANAIVRYEDGLIVIQEQIAHHLR